MNLSFDALREANALRLSHFKNRFGEAAHKEADGSDWALSTWANAVQGELGESIEALLTMLHAERAHGRAANLIKKIERGDYMLDEVRTELAHELADVSIYLDILAMRCGIDLGEAIKAKFNAKSREVGSVVGLASTGAFNLSEISDDDIPW